MQKLKSLLGRLLPLPEDELDGILKYVMSFKSIDEQVEYLETLLGQDNVADIISALSGADDIPTTSSPPQKIEQTSGADSGSKKNAYGKKPVVCDCQANEHDLLDNCLECGRILCVRESFPCLFCGNDPNGDADNIELSTTSGKSRKKKFVKFDPQSAKKQSIFTAATKDQSNTVSNASSDPHLDNANKHLEKLLKFDREDAVRSRVHDLAEDYHSVETNVWLSPAERALALKEQMEYERKVEEERRKIRINIDFDSTKLTEAKREMPDAPDFSGLTAGRKKPENHDYDSVSVYEQEGEVKYIPSRGALEALTKATDVLLQRPSVLQTDNDDLLSLLI